MLKSILPEFVGPPSKISKDHLYYDLYHDLNSRMMERLRGKFPLSHFLGDRRGRRIKYVFGEALW